jgi:ectoine hydroxylase-related dioxygenase (phytanoyl-CoA dioxygenase family)
MKRADQYNQDGFLLVRGLFSANEVEVLKARFMEINAHGPEFTELIVEGGYNKKHADPLRQFPRLMQPHLGEKLAMEFALDERIRTVLLDILQQEPYLVQTMVYFKPAGARGQALHQDQRYLRVQPGTCIAAWMALDPCDTENGCLQVVPGSHRLPVLCPIDADTRLSFTDETVPIPAGMEVEDVLMEPGDILFFHGNLIHGSGPNVSENRFRRIIVGHYIHAETSSVHRWYGHILRFDGTKVEDVTLTDDGLPCGVFVQDEGDLVLQMAGSVDEARAAH